MKLYDYYIEYEQVNNEKLYKRINIVTEYCKDGTLTSYIN